MLHTISCLHYTLLKLHYTAPQTAQSCTASSCVTSCSKLHRTTSRLHHELLKVALDRKLPKSVLPHELPAPQVAQSRTSTSCQNYKLLKADCTGLHPSCIRCFFSGLLSPKLHCVTSCSKLQCITSSSKLQVAQRCAVPQVV